MTAEPTLAAIVLAAGASARLGMPKALIEYRGETLLARAICAAASVADLAPIVVLGAAHERIRKQLSTEHARVIVNSDWATGQSTSLRAGVAALPRCDAALVCLCDQPLVDGTALERLREAWLDAPRRLIASVYDGTRGAPAIFPRARFDDLCALTGDCGARRLLHDDDVWVVGVPEAAFDIDTPADLERLRATELRGAGPASRR